MIEGKYNHLIIDSLFLHLKILLHPIIDSLPWKHENNCSKLQNAEREVDLLSKTTQNDASETGPVNTFVIRLKNIHLLSSVES